MMKYINNRGIHLIVVSFVVFAVLNVIENHIHYSIGRSYEKENIEIVSPTKRDWLRIITVMIIFAILQSILTYIFD